MLPTAPHMREWADIFMHPSKTRPHTLIIAPPGSSKTSWSSKFLPCFLIGQDPGLHVGVVTSTAKRATKLSLSCRDTVTDIPEYQQVFPHVKPNKSKGWRQDQWFVERPRKDDPDPTMTTCGLFGDILGSRLDFLIFDDVFDEEVAFSDTLRDRGRRWVRNTAMTRLDPSKGRAVAILCITGDAPVTMSDGSWKRAKDIRPGDFVLSWDNHSQVAKKVLNWKSSGEDDVFELRTENLTVFSRWGYPPGGNHKVKANARHPFLVMRDWEEDPHWVQLADIKKGDIVISLGEFSASRSKATLTEDQAWLLGYMFGDGWITVWRKETWKSRERRKKNPDAERGYSTTCQAMAVCAAYGIYPDLNQQLLDTFQRVFGKQPKKTKFGYYRSDSIPMAKWFLEMGLTGQAKTKRLPQWLYSEPVHVREAFLSGFSSADGNPIKQDGAGGPNDNRMSLVSCNGDLIEDLKQLCLLLGYIPSNHYWTAGWRQPPHSPVPIWAEYHNIQYNETKDRNTFRFSRVKSIKPVGREEVFDIQVEDSENFIAGGLVVHNTRWSGVTEDLVAEFEHDKRWQVVRMPAIGYYGDGGSIWPDRLPLEFLLDEQERDPLSFEAVYQGNPSLAEGDIFKRAWWRWLDLDVWPNKFETIVQVWDTAYKKGKKNDYSACVTLGILRGNIYILHALREKLEWPALMATAAKQYHAFKPRLVLIEDSASGQSLLQAIRAQSAPMIPVQESVRGQQDKRAFVSPVSGFVEGGRVVLPKDVKWTQLLVSECANFNPDREQKDDLVLAFAHGMRWLTKSKTISLTDDCCVLIPASNSESGGVGVRLANALGMGIPSGGNNTEGGYWFDAM